MIKKSYVPFYQSLIFLFLLAVVASVSKNTCISIFFNKFSSNSRPLASNFSILLSNLLKNISIQVSSDEETTTARRKQKNNTLVDRKQLITVCPKSIQSQHHCDCAYIAELTHHWNDNLRKNIEPYEPIMNSRKYICILRILNHQ